MLASNKKAYHDYHILKKIEAGIKLSGPEVKSAKKGEINLKGSYINIESNKKAIILNTYISAYKPAATDQRLYDPYRNRTILLHKKELNYLLGKSKEAGITIIPLKLYLKNRIVKLEIGICRGKKKYDKREDLKKRDFKRRKTKLLY